jgi:hypothetical protein
VESGDDSLLPRQEVTTPAEYPERVLGSLRTVTSWTTARRPKGASARLERGRSL